MNIIVADDKSVRLTQYSGQSAQDIEEILIYISKKLLYNGAMLILNLKPEDSETLYPFLLEEEMETANYVSYHVYFSQTAQLSERYYTFFLDIDDLEIELGSFLIKAFEEIIMRRGAMMSKAEVGDDPLPYGLSDMHEPVDIQDRDILISKNKNTLVAEDNISQCITFRVLQYYDGIDLSTKNIYFDYINSDGELMNLFVDPQYLQTHVHIDGDDRDYMLIPVAIPYDVVKVAGTVEFGLSATNIIEVTNAQGEISQTQYVWQTKPSYLIVQDNLAPRNSTPVSPGSSSTDVIVAQLATITNWIEHSDVGLLDDDDYDGEVVLVAGDASDS